jgi:hypothetical protein
MKTTTMRNKSSIMKSKDSLIIKRVELETVQAPPGFHVNSLIEFEFRVRLRL